MLRRFAAQAPKNRSRAAPFVRFSLRTFGARVNASHCLITCPKRHIQLLRYVQVCQEITKIIIKYVDRTIEKI
jgi:hypothetical protein